MVARKQARYGRAVHPRYVSDVDKFAGERVRSERITQNMSQETLAKHIGVTFQQVQKYEKGANRITVGRLAQIAEVLQVSIYTLLPPEGTTTPNLTDACSILSRTRMGHRVAAAFNALPNELLRTAYTNVLEAMVNSVPEPRAKAG